MRLLRANYPKVVSVYTKEFASLIARKCYAGEISVILL